MLRLRLIVIEQSPRRVLLEAYVFFDATLHYHYYSQSICYRTNGACLITSFSIGHRAAATPFLRSGAASAPYCPQFWTLRLSEGIEH